MTITLEIKDDTLVAVGPIPQEIREIFCELCGKKGTKECDTMVCQVACKWCG